MFTLRETHNQAFQTKAEADFVCEVMQYLRENHAETIVKLPDGEFKVIALPEAILQKMVEGGIRKARNYGMTWQSSLISFVVIMFVSAPNFDENDNIRKLLTEELGFPDYRISKIWSETSDKIWNRIIENYKTESW